MKEKYEYIKNLEQANKYLMDLGIDIQVGITGNKIFFVRFDVDKLDGYQEAKSAWMKRTDK